MESEPLQGNEQTSDASLTQKILAELIGTAFLVFIVTGTIVFQIGYYAVYAAFVLCSMIYVFGRISGGHFNPAVTIPMFLRHKITLMDCIYYIIAQISGGFIGSILVGLCNRVSFKYMGATYVPNDDGKGFFSAFLIEVILTFGLVFVIFA